MSVQMSSNRIELRRRNIPAGAMLVLAPLRDWRWLRQVRRRQDMSMTDHRAEHRRGDDRRSDRPAPRAKVHDPVCGMTVDPAGARYRAEHGGATFYFCSAGCQAKFTADP